MHVLVRVDARDDRFAFHFRSPRSAACSAPGSPRHCTDGSATIQLACPIVRAHAPIRSWQDSGTRMPGRDRSDLRTAEEASAGQWVIVPAFSIRVALRRGNRAPLPRPAVPASPENNYQCRSQGCKRAVCSEIRSFSPHFRNPSPRKVPAKPITQHISSKNGWQPVLLAPGDFSR